MTWSVRDNGGNKVMIELLFNTAPFSDMYKVYIHSADFHTKLSHTVLKVLAVLVNIICIILILHSTQHDTFSLN